MNNLHILLCYSIAKMNISFSIGKSYSNFKELEDEIALYEKQEFVNLRKVNGHLLTSVKARNKLIEHYKDDLKYYDIDYICKHSGNYRPHRAKQNDNATSTWTTKQNCPFVIRFRASKDGTSLVCVKLVTDHNHIVSKESFDLDYMQRRLDDDTKYQIAQMTKVNANRKLIQTHVAKTTGKMVPLKDIHNISSKAKLSDPQNLEQIDKWLEENYPNSSHQYIVNDKNILAGIFVQDSIMQKIFQSYPEVLLIDAKHKTNNKNMVLFAMMAIDGNGDSHVVAAFLAQDESEVCLRAMVKLFQDNNPQWKSTEVIITDKDLTERQVLREEFPNCHLQICLFHVLRTFSREISISKMGITAAQKITASTLIQQIAYSRNEADYMAKYSNLKASVPEKILNYFDKNWHSIREEWVEGLKLQQLNFSTRTNNRIESFFQKLSSCVSRSCNLTELLGNFWGLIATLRFERRFRLVQQQQKTSTKENELTIAEQEFEKYLTPFAFTHVQKQIEFAKNVKVLDENTVETSSGMLYPTKEGCTCCTYMSMGLPCRHIFALLQVNKESQFCPDLVHTRWKSSHYFDTFNESATTMRSKPTVTTLPQQRSLTSNQKYRKAWSHFQTMISHLVDCGTAEFESKLQQSMNMLDSWKSSNKVNSDHEQEDAAKSCEQADASYRKTAKPQTIAPKNTKKKLNPCSDEQSSNSLATVKIPLPTKKRGRPKGATTTAIGQTRVKRKKMGTCIKFFSKPIITRQRLMLSWFVDDTLAKKVTSCSKVALLGEEKVECNPTNLCNAVKNDNVDINFIRRYFDDDGWLAVTTVHQQALAMPWKCSLCATDLMTQKSIQCDGCLEWNHMKCMNLSGKPVGEWFCDICKSNVSKG